MATYDILKLHKKLLTYFLLPQPTVLQTFTE